MARAGRVIQCQSKSLSGLVERGTAGSTRPGSEETRKGNQANVCGIIGYVGHRPCEEILLRGLQRLEYRGYDSAGLAFQEGGRIESVRAVGNLSSLGEALATRTLERGSARNGVAHNGAVQNDNGQVVITW